MEEIKQNIAPLLKVVIAFALVWLLAFVFMASAVLVIDHYRPQLDELDQITWHEQS